MQTPDAVIAVTPVVAALESMDVPYYLGGSIASSAYGTARATLDVDLVADLAPKHVEGLVASLESDYYINKQAVFDAVADRSCFNVIHLATMFKVDVFVVKDRPYDREALGRVRKAPLQLETTSAEFFLASPEDVVLNKLLWFRLGDELSEQQWRDILGVIEVQGNSLARDYLSKWAKQLAVADLLEKAFKEALL